MEFDDTGGITSLERRRQPRDRPLHMLMLIDVPVGGCLLEMWWGPPTWFDALGPLRARLDVPERDDEGQES